MAFVCVRVDSGDSRPLRMQCRKEEEFDRGECVLFEACGVTVLWCHMGSEVRW